MTKKILWWGVIIILILLDLAALNDITQGTEPNYRGEYSVLIFSVVVFIVIAVIKFRKK
jgi:hypothetical protein